MPTPKNSFISGLETLEAVYKNPASQLALEAARSTIDLFLGSTTLAQGDERTEQIALLRKVRQQAGLPDFEMLPETELGSDVLEFDFDALAITNSLGITIHSFGRRTRMVRERHMHALSRPMRETFAIASHLSKSPAQWISATILYRFIEPKHDLPQTFNNRFIVVREVLGSRIATTNTSPRNIMVVEPFTVREKVS